MPCPLFLSLVRRPFLAVLIYSCLTAGTIQAASKVVLRDWITGTMLQNGQPTPFNLGSVPVGGTLYHNLSVENNGTTDLHLTSLTLPAGYECTTPLFSAAAPLTVQPNDAVTLWIQFPAIGATGVYSGTLTLTSDAPTNGSFQVPLTLRVVSGGPPGVLDPAFGTGGKLVVPGPATPADEEASGAGAQSTGKVILGLGGFKLLRVNADGTPDTTFGTAGRLTAYPRGQSGPLLVQPDDKILLAGADLDAATNGFVLVRLKADGTPDNSFGSGGSVVTHVGASNAYAAAMALQPDGKILVAGSFTDVDDTEKLALVRYTAAGVLDSSFGAGGVVVNTLLDTAYPGSLAIAVQAGRILLIGTAPWGQYNLGTGVTAYTGDGVQDTSYFNGGFMPFQAGTGDSWPSSALVQPDGKVIIVGTAYASTGSLTFFAARLLINGGLDSGFGSGGQVLVTFAGSSIYHASSSLAAGLTYDGRIVIGGEVGDADHSYVSYALAGLTSTGQADTATGARLTPLLSDPVDRCKGVLILPDNKFLLYGTAGEPPLEKHLHVGLMRFGADLAPTITTAFAMPTANGAYITSSVNPNGADTSVYVEYDTSLPYHQATAGKAIGHGKSSVNVTFNLSGLPPQTKCHWRLVARNGDTTTTTADLTFTTLAPQLEMYDGTDTSGAQFTSGQAQAVGFGPAGINGFTTHTFTVRNISTSALQLSVLTLPASYQFAGGDFSPVTLAAGDIWTFSVRLVGDGQHLGAFGGDMILESHSQGNPSFIVPVTGTIVPGSTGLDTSFNATGEVTTTLGNGNQHVGSVLVLDNGDIIVGGSSSVGVKSAFALAKYKVDGSLDSTFGTGGKVLTTFSSGNGNSHGRAAALQADGKIVMAGSAEVSGNLTAFALVRYNTDGSLDPTFGTGGRVTTSLIGPVASISDEAYAVAIQPDGKILAAGASATNGVENYLELARYTADGTLDPTFHGGGWLGMSGCAARRLLVQPDGKILVTGFDTNSGSGQFEVYRFNTDGYPDPAFHSYGFTRFPVGTGISHATSLALQPDGRIILAGRAGNGTVNDFALARCNADGSLETTFGNGGTLITHVGTGDNAAQDVAVDTAGRILVAGYATTASGGKDFALVRYNAGGSLDTSFNGLDGKVIFPMAAGTRPDMATALALRLPQNQAVVAGEASDSVNSHFALARYQMEAPPVAATGAVSTLAKTSTTLNGNLFTQGQAATAWFEWGTTTAFGHATPSMDFASPADGQPVSTALTGLAVGTLYHFRMAVTISGTTVYGPDHPFTTLPLSTEGRLAGISLSHSAGALDVFNANTRTYAVNVGNEVATLTVTPAALDPAASVTVNDQPALPSVDVDLAVGSQWVSIYCTPESGGSPVTYSLYVTRLQSSLRFYPSTFSTIETAGRVAVTIAREGDTSGTAFVTLETVDGTATVAGRDYTPVTGRVVNFAAGQGNATVDIPILNRHGVGALPRSFTVTLSNARQGLAVNAPVATVTIDKAGTVTFDAPVVEVRQGSDVSLTLRRSGGGAAFDVTFTLTDGAASTGNPPLRPAVYGKDYGLVGGPSRTVHFPAGVDTVNVVVGITSPASNAPTKHFTATLSAPTQGALLGENASTDVRILSPDATRPTVAIALPAAGATVVSIDTVDVYGTATDKNGISSVKVSLNNGPYADASLDGGVPVSTGETVHYGLSVTPVEGANTLTVQATDLQGNTTTSAKRTFTWHQAALLTAVRMVPFEGLSKPDTVGSFTVTGAVFPATPNLASKSAVVRLGTKVTLTPTTRPGYMFSGWAGGDPLMPVTHGPGGSLTLTLQGGALLFPTWVRNPYYPGAGGYRGLVTPHEGTAAGNATRGLLSLALANTGSFTGTLFIDGGAYPFTGSFDVNGIPVFGKARTAMLTIDRYAAHKENLTLSLLFNAATGNNQVTGTLVIPGTGTCDVVADKARYATPDPLLPPLPVLLLTSATTGTYTVSFPHKEQTPPLDVTTYPQGDGYATATLTKTGALTFAGTLADGTAFSASSFLVAGNGVVSGGNAPFFIQLPTPGAPATVKGGSVSGTLTFEGISTGSEVQGTDLLWFRPASTADLYTSGWPGGITVDALGGKYLASVSAATALKLPPRDAINGNARLRFTGGRQAQAVTFTNFNIVGNTVTKIPATEPAYSLLITGTTGVFTGTFQSLSPAMKPAFKGVLLQGSVRGTGFFLSNAPGDKDPESGGVVLSSP